jgi:hypothetical protein
MHIYFFRIIFHFRNIRLAKIIEHKKMVPNLISRSDEGEEDCTTGIPKQSSQIWASSIRSNNAMWIFVFDQQKMWATCDDPPCDTEMLIAFRKTPHPSTRGWERTKTKEWKHDARGASDVRGRSNINFVIGIWHVDTRVFFSLIISLFKELNTIHSVEIGHSVLLRRLP